MKIKLLAWTKQPPKSEIQVGLLPPVEAERLKPEEHQARNLLKEMCRHHHEHHEGQTEHQERCVLGETRAKDQRIFMIGLSSTSAV